MLWDIDVNHTIALLLDPGIVVSVGIGLTAVSGGTYFDPRQQTYKPSVVQFQFVRDGVRISNEFGSRKSQRQIAETNSPKKAKGDLRVVEYDN